MLFHWIQKKKSHFHASTENENRVLFLPEVSFSNYKHKKQEQGHDVGDMADCVYLCKFND